MTKSSGQNKDDALAKMMQWVESFEESTEDARGKSERDRDYYDGKQWTDEEISELNRRMQPPVTINRIAKKINYLLGTEIRTRTDPTAAPRTPKHEDGAIAVTDALRYVADVEDLPQSLSEVFESFGVEGYGAIVVETEERVSMTAVAESATVREDSQTSTQVSVGSPEVDIKVRAVPWDRTIYDPHSRRWDMADAKWVGEVLWMDSSEFIDFYGKEAKQNLEDAITAGEQGTDDTLDDRPKKWVDGKRDRVKVVEMYYKSRGNWHVCHFTSAGFVPGHEPQKTQYVDDLGRTVCPMIMASCFVDRENQRYGLVRNMISPQDEVNKRRSKALHILSMRQSIGEDGAVDPQDAKTQLAKPDGHVSVQPNSRFEILPTGDMAAAQFQLLQEAKAEIDTIGPDAGVVAGNSQGQSGRAVLARQQMASLELEKVFDRFRWIKLQTYRQIWYRIRQFWDYEKWMRVRDDDERQGYRFVALNMPTTKGERLQEQVKEGQPVGVAAQQLGFKEIQMIMQSMQQQLQMAQQQGQQIPPEMIDQYVLGALMQTQTAQEPMKLNDVAGLDVDIVLSEAPDTAIVQQEEFEALATMAGQGLPIPPDIIIEASDLRNKKKLLEMMRKPPDPAAAQQQQLQQQMGQAQLAKVGSEAQRNQAQAAKYAAEAQTEPIKTQSDAIKTQSKAQRDQAASLKDATVAGQNAGDLATAFENPQ